MAQEISRDRNDYRFQTELRVRLAETDAVGIVFFGSFAGYMDVGRMDYLENLGLSERYGNASLIPGAVVAAETRFHAPARYNDRLLIDVRMAHVGDTSYTFHFVISQRRSRALLATGAMTLVWLDDAFRPIRVPDGFREVIRRFEGDDSVVPAEAAS